MECRNRNRSLPGFTLGFSHIRCFNPVIDTVTQDMNERGFRPLQNLLVQFRLFPGNDQPDLFALLKGDVPHHPGESLKQGGDGHHFDLFDPGLQFIDDRVQVKGFRGDMVIELQALFSELLHLGFALAEPLRHLSFKRGKFFLHRLT